MERSEMVLHGTPLSGHTHRVALLRRMLRLPYRFIDALAEVRRGPDFRLNPLRKVPVRRDGNLVLAESAGLPRVCAMPPLPIPGVG